MTDSPRVAVAPPFSAERAALNFAARLLRLDYDDYELRHSHLAATDTDVPAIREALRDLADRLATGVVLPTGTETVEQWGTRLTWDGHTEEHLTGRSRDDAQRRVDLHRRARVEQPGWRATAELVHRHQHTTPWEPVPADQAREDHDEILEALGNASFRIWTCPVRAHTERTCVTVEWRDNIAYCTFPGCGRSSQRTPEETP
jgi:hypothetical protein